MVLNKVAMFSSFEILITFSVTILLQIAFSGVNHGGTNAAPSRPNHFGDPCKLCQCFVQYADRDITIFASPYKIVKDPYATTEDQCLYSCLHDPNCTIAMFGFVGGRDVFACELYNGVDVAQQKPIYVPFSNLYLKKVAKCPKDDLELLPKLEFVEADAETKETIFRRKNRYVQLWFKQNFFNLG